MKIQPILDNILIKPLFEGSKTATGILLPITKKQPEKGIVVAIGEGVDNGVKVGDKVLFKKWEVFEIPIEGEKDKWIILKQEHILAIL
jgi:chaperonin GroES